MDFREVATEIKQKQQKVKELSAVISVYAMKSVSREVKAKEEELQDRMRFRLAELRQGFELEALNTKIKVMSELIDVLKRGQL